MQCPSTSRSGSCATAEWNACPDGQQTLSPATLNHRPAGGVSLKVHQRQLLRSQGCAKKLTEHTTTTACSQAASIATEQPAEIQERVGRLLHRQEHSLARQAGKWQQPPGWRHCSRTPGPPSSPSPPCRNLSSRNSASSTGASAARPCVEEDSGWAVRGVETAAAASAPQPQQPVAPHQQSNPNTPPPSIQSPLLTLSRATTCRTPATHKTAAIQQRAPGCCSPPGRGPARCAPSRPPAPGYL